MADVAVHLRVAPGADGAVRAVLLEEVEVLSLSLLRAFKEVVNVRTGRTRDRISADPPTQIGGIWRLRFRAPFWIRFLQTGARPHTIAPRHGTRSGGQPELRLAVGGYFTFAAEVHHPGMHRTHLVEKALARAVPGIALHLKKAMGQAVASELRAAVR